MIGEQHKHALDILGEAFCNEDIALVECEEVATGKLVCAICAVNKNEDGTYEFVPLAKMFDGNPYEELKPPAGVEDVQEPYPHESPTVQ